MNYLTKDISWNNIGKFQVDRGLAASESDAFLTPCRSCGEKENDKKED